MKATIDLDDTLYQQLKVEAARRGRTVREMVAEGIRAVLDTPVFHGSASQEVRAPAWYGSLGSYAAHAERHDLDAMRASIARGRKTKAR